MFSAAPSSPARVTPGRGGEEPKAPAEGAGAGFAPGVAQGQGRAVRAAPTGALARPGARHSLHGLPLRPFSQLSQNSVFPGRRRAPSQGVPARGAVDREAEVIREGREATRREAGERSREGMGKPEKRGGEKKKEKQ